MKKLRKTNVIGKSIEAYACACFAGCSPFCNCGDSPSDAQSRNGKTVSEHNETLTTNSTYNRLFK